MPLEEETPEEFAIHSLENIARLVKNKHSKVKVAVVLLKYNDERFSKERKPKTYAYILKNISTEQNL